MTTTTQYIPGVCNINYEEIARRRKLGHVSAAASLILLAVLLIANVDRLYNVVLFLPLFGAASGYLQARNKFCVGYAAAGKQNAADGSTDVLDVIEAAARKADKRKALILNAQAFGIAAVVTVLAMLIPQF